MEVVNEFREMRFRNYLPNGLIENGLVDYKIIQFYWRQLDGSLRYISWLVGQAVLAGVLCSPCCFLFPYSYFSSGVPTRVITPDTECQKRGEGRKKRGNAEADPHRRLFFFCFLQGTPWGSRHEGFCVFFFTPDSLLRKVGSNTTSVIPPILSNVHWRAWHRPTRTEKYKAEKSNEATVACTRMAR